MWYVRVFAYALKNKSPVKKKKKKCFEQSRMDKICKEMILDKINFKWKVTESDSRVWFIMKGFEKNVGSQGFYASGS